MVGLVYAVHCKETYYTCESNVTVTSTYNVLCLCRFNYFHTVCEYFLFFSLLQGLLNNTLSECSATKNVYRHDIIMNSSNKNSEGKNKQ